MVVALAVRLRLTSDAVCYVCSFTLGVTATRESLPGRSLRQRMWLTPSQRGCQWRLPHSGRPNALEMGLHARPLALREQLVP